MDEPALSSPDAMLYHTMRLAEAMAEHEPWNEHAALWADILRAQWCKRGTE